VGFVSCVRYIVRVCVCICETCPSLQHPTFLSWPYHRSPHIALLVEQVLVYSVLAPSWKVVLH
jgi:hypothetical protein